MPCDSHSPDRLSPGSTTDVVRLAGKYDGLVVDATERSALRQLVNLVNVQGAGRISVSPARLAPGLEDQLESLAGSALWRDWWRGATNAEVVLSTRAAEPTAAPTVALTEADPEAITVGLNVGGHFLRIVRCRGRVIEHSRSVRLGSGTDSILAKRGLAAITEPAEELIDGAAAVGIAWAGPTFEGRVRPLSLQTRASAEMAELLRDGDLEQHLERRWRCPVSSWNDGMAVAASHAHDNSERPSRNQLVLKLGTSLAAGLARGREVLELPLELAKCILDVEPMISYAHPTVGLWGTARDLIGAEPMLSTYRVLSRHKGATFVDLQDEALDAPRSQARLVLDRAAEGVAALARLAQTFWRDLELVLTGANLADPRLRELFPALVRDHLHRMASSVPVRSSSNDPDLSAAHGGALLARCAR